MTNLLACPSGGGSGAEASSTTGTEVSSTTGTEVSSTTDTEVSDTTTTIDDGCASVCDTTGGDVLGPGVPMALSIQYADGVGGFGEPQLVALDLGDDAIESYPVELLVADLDGDEHVDLLVYHSREILALAGMEGGGFMALDSIFVENLRQVVPANDVDGAAGVLVYDPTTDDDDRLLFHPWNGAGFEAEQAYIAPPQGALGSGDLNGDGVADAVVAGRDQLQSDGIDVYTFMSIGDAGGVASGTYSNLVDSSLPNTIDIVDLDDDGLMDVVMTVDDHDYSDIESPVTGAIVLLPGDGAGAFLMPSATELEYAPTDALVGDFDGSSGLDVMVRDGVAELYVAFNGGTGLLSPQPLGEGDLDLFAVGHVDDAARSDALVGLSQLFVLEGLPEGTFDWVELDGNLRLDDRATLADVDGDGFDDVIHAVRPNL